MSEGSVAVVVTVSEEHFSDDDCVCINAAKHVCAKLRTHLLQQGHLVPDWIQDGCDEDWGVYFESKLNDKTFEYHICFFAGPSGTTQNQMLIQYRIRRTLMQRLCRKSNELPPDTPMHETMRSFGELFCASRMLTQTQFVSEY